MSTNKTTHLSLHQWAQTDPIHRTEFNENFQSIDDVVAELQTAVQSAGNSRIVYGTYTGTGTFGKENPTQLNNLSAALGTSPKLVFVSAPGSGDYLFLIRGVTSQTSNLASTFSDRFVSITWSDAGVSWYGTYSAQYQLNGKGTTYHYVAIG